MDFAPDADVLVNPGNTVVSRRSFGADPLVVSEMVAEEIRGLQAQGVWGCLLYTSKRAVVNHSLLFDYFISFPNL